MLMKKRTFTKEDKLLIIKETSEHGVANTLEKYGVYPASFYSWKKKLDQMGEIGLQHGMTPQHLKRIRQLEKELVGQLKSELLKKTVCLGEKKEIVNRYIFQGLKRDSALAIAGVSKHQYYYCVKLGHRGESDRVLL